MSGNYVYPEKFDQENPTPELMDLWDEAMIILKARRDRALLWQVPAFIIFWLITFFVSGELFLAVGIVHIVAFGLAAQGIYPNFEYRASDDRKSATLEFCHKWSFKRFIEVPVSAFAKAKEGFGGLLIAIISFFSLPLWWGFISFFYSLVFFNNLWWLKDFLEWRDYLMKKAGSNDQRQHLRGTNILPSVQLSGSSPSGAAPPPIQQEPLEVLDGLLTLLPDGGIALAGGIAFDRNSTFTNFSMNGLTLTRETEAQLKVSHEGSDKSFRFDGNSWLSV
jgi:hypothetical protein